MRARSLRIAADFLQPVHLPHGHLELEPEHLLLHFLEPLLQLVLVEIPNFLRFHSFPLPALNPPTPG